MIALHGLRILGDLAFYYAFAGFFAAGCGGHPTVWVLLWPTVCFAAAAYFRGNPAALCFQEMARIGSPLVYSR